jgi:hypothetical protein
MMLALVQSYKSNPVRWNVTRVLPAVVSALMLLNKVYANVKLMLGYDNASQSMLLTILNVLNVFSVQYSDPDSVQKLLELMLTLTSINTIVLLTVRVKNLLPSILPSMSPNNTQTNTQTNDRIMSIIACFVIPLFRETHVQINESGNAYNYNPFPFLFISLTGVFFIAAFGMSGGMIRECKDWERVVEVKGWGDSWA